MIAEPPFEAGAVKVTVAWALPATAVTAVGAPGAVAGADGVTELEAVLETEVPTAFVAATVKVYAVPFVRPVTTVGIAVVEVALRLPGFDVIAYRVIGDPPVEDGAEKETVAWAFPGTAETFCGALGTVILVRVYAWVVVADPLCT